MKKNILCIVMLMLAMNIFAQVPQSFSYQVVVRDTQGQPLSNQSVGIKISLQNEDGATIHYSESHLASTSLLGVITLSVGGGTVISGDFSLIPWSEGNIFLKIEVDPSGGENYVELGFVELQSVPYAQFAASGNEGPQGEAGLSAYQVWLAQGNTGTEEEFLASLMGDAGEPGAEGSDGLSAYQIWLAEGNTGTEEEFLASLKGDTGNPGDAGSDGLSAYQIWLAEGNTGTETDFIASLKGEKGKFVQRRYVFWINQ